MGRDNSECMRNGHDGATPAPVTIPEDARFPVVARSRPRPEPSARALQEAEAAVARLLGVLGESPEREGLRETPARVVRALFEMTAGYAQDPAEILGRVFHESHDETILVAGIPFTSLCEHHLLPVQGTATVAYLPEGRVSKISRVVQAFARRLQLQERMTDQIADAMQEHLAPRGVGVFIRAHHACMGLRGVRTPAPMVTTAFRGELREPARRNDFLTILKTAEGG
jgi:GTP cyclohydrolase IA